MSPGLNENKYEKAFVVRIVSIVKIRIDIRIKFPTEGLDALITRQEFNKINVMLYILGVCMLW